MVAEAYLKKHIRWESPVTFCVSLVSMKPQREITLLSQYRYGNRGETRFSDTSSDEKWETNRLGEAQTQFTWAQSMYDQMFYL
jgi:hypothetical protein